MPSETQKHSDSRKQTDQLIRDWLLRFGVDFNVDVAPRLPVWLDAFGGMKPEVLESLFRKAQRACKFFPKVVDILEPLSTVKQNATDEAADLAWNRVLEIRRVHWNPDIPGPFDRACARLSERVRQAARASGIFREFTSEEYEKGALHTWAKKHFLESFHAWGEAEQDKFLLPDGETRKLLIEFAETKALPWTKPKEAPQLPAEERLRVADELAKAARKVLEICRPSVYEVKDTPERREELRYQAEFIRKNYPPKQLQPHDCGPCCPCKGKAVTA